MSSLKVSFTNMQIIAIGCLLKKEIINVKFKVISLKQLLFNSGLHKLWYPGIQDTSTWSKFGAHGEHGDVFLFSNLGAL